MTKTCKAGRFFRRANESAWNEMTEEVFKELVPIFPSKKMKDNNWKAHYYWEWPYGEVCEFADFLRKHFKVEYSPCWNIYRIKVGKAEICGSITRNEVGEPFLDCNAYLSKDTLMQITNLIDKLWYED